MLYDKDIRESLFDFLDETYGKNRILEEKRTGRSRADVVMVTDEALYGLEIKSDADSYTRLAGQIKDYDQYYDYNYAVIGTRHAMHIREHIPEYWGVITVEEVDGNPDFYVFRKPSRNPKVKLERKLSILWRPELQQIQDKWQMPKYKGKSRDFVIGRIKEKVPEDIPEILLMRQVCEILLERDYTNVQEQLKEYRKGEIQKQLEKEPDPERRIQLLGKREAALVKFKRKKRYRRRRNT